MRSLMAGLLTGALLVAGCGGSDDDGTASRSLPAPEPAEFPAANGRPLEQVLSVATSEGPVISPAAQVLRQGENRFPFGVFTVDREQVTDAQVAIYAAPGAGLKGPAIGPFTARIEDLTTEPAFRAKTTADDPDAAQVAYVTEIPLNKPGPWTFGALTKDGDSYSGSLLATPSKVGEFNPVDMGEMAPRISTPTVADVSDIGEIETRDPPDSLHEEDLADVLGKKPVVLLFATPALCQSRVCGPVVDAAEQVKRDFGDEATFIHQEVYVDNDLNKGPRPQMEAYRLTSEPWLFVIDRDGKVTTAIEGAFSVAELEAAVREVTG